MVGELPPRQEPELQVAAGRGLDQQQGFGGEHDPKGVRCERCVVAGPDVGKNGGR